MTKPSKMIKSSGNVFADIGFGKAEANALLHRARLMMEIGAKLRTESKTQQQLGEILGIGQSRVSDLMKGKAQMFSLDMLLTFADKLGMKVKVEVESG